MGRVVELTQKQIEDLNAGKAIFVEGMQRKDGEVFSSFIKAEDVNWDELAGIGILKDELEMSGELDTLLSGKVTRL